jgi:acetolactate decarboxylase
MDTLKFFLGIGLAIVLVFSAASVYTQFNRGPTLPTDRDTAYQISTIDALMQGVFDGIQPVGELRKHGDFGIGVSDALDGELIVLDGIVYQAKADGSIYQAPDSLTTPFATVTYFERDHSTTTGNPMNFSVFSSTMSSLLPSQNMVYAVRIHGAFPSMKVRSEAAQQKPYPTLPDALKNQSVYSFTNITGTISDDRQAGGHILDFTMPVNTPVEYDITPEFYMILPTSGGFTGVDLSQDLSEELAEVEK